MAVYLTGYSDCLTGFREPTGLKNVWWNHWGTVSCFYRQGLASIQISGYSLRGTVPFDGRFKENKIYIPTRLILSFLLPSFPPRRKTHALKTVLTWYLYHVSTV